MILNSKLLYAALRKAGVSLAPGRGPSAEQFSDAIEEENRMIGGWNCNPLNIFKESVDLWSTVANQQSYTLGKDPTGLTTANWDGQRPQKITRANLLLPNAADPTEKIRRKLDIWTKDDWAAIQFQAVYSYPEGLYNDGGAAPFSRIYFKPIPDAIYQIELFTWLAIPVFTSLNDVVLLPPGYEDAIVNNLAVRLASMPWTVQVPMNPQVRVDAQLSLAALQNLNARAPRMSTDEVTGGGGGTYNWRSGLVE